METPTPDTGNLYTAEIETPVEGFELQTFDDEPYQPKVQRLDFTIDKDKSTLPKQAFIPNPISPIDRQVESARNQYIKQRAQDESISIEQAESKIERQERKNLFRENQERLKPVYETVNGKENPFRPLPQLNPEQYRSHVNFKNDVDKYVMGNVKNLPEGEKIRGEQSYWVSKKFNPYAIRGIENYVLDYFINNPEEESVINWQSDLGNKKRISLLSEEKQAQIIDASLAVPLQKLREDIDGLKNQGAETVLTNLNSISDQIKGLQEKAKNSATTLEKIEKSYLQDAGLLDFLGEYNRLSDEINKNKQAAELATELEQLQQIEPENEIQAQQINQQIQTITNTPQFQEYISSYQSLQDLRNNIVETSEEIKSDAEYKKATQDLQNANRNILSSIQYFDQIKSDYEPLLNQYIEKSEDYNDLVGARQRALNYLPDQKAYEDKIERLNREPSSIRDFLAPFANAGLNGVKGIFSGTTNIVGDLEKAITGEKYSSFGVASKMIDEIGGVNAPFAESTTSLITPQGNFNFNSKGLLNDLGRVGGFMSTLILAGKPTFNVAKGLGYSDKAAQTVATVMPAYLGSYNEYSNLAKEKGYTGVQQVAFANSGALFEGLSELIFPEWKVIDDAIKRSTMQSIKKNAPFKSYMKEVLTAIGKENAEELSVEFAGTLNTALANVLGDEQAKVELPKMANIQQAVLLSSITGGFFGNIRGLSQRGRLNEWAEVTLGENRDVAVETVETMESNNVINSEQAESLINNIDSDAEVLNKMPPNLSTQKKAAILPLIKEKEQLEHQANNEGLDATFREAFQKRANEKSAEIEKIINDENFEETFNKEATQEEKDIQLEEQPPETIPTVVEEPTEQTVETTEEVVETSSEEIIETTETQIQEENAIQEPSTEEIPIRQQPESRERIREEDTQREEVTQESQKEESSTEQEAQVDGGGNQESVGPTSEINVNSLIEEYNDAEPKRKIAIQRSLRETLDNNEVLPEGEKILSEQEMQSATNLLSTEGKPFIPKQEIETLNAQAKELGYENIYQATNSVNKRLGTSYNDYRDIPQSELQEVSDQRTHPETPQEQTEEPSTESTKNNDLKPLAFRQSKPEFVDRNEDKFDTREEAARFWEDTREQSTRDLQKTREQLEVNKAPSFNVKEESENIVKASILPVQPIVKSAFNVLNKAQDETIGRFSAKAEDLVTKQLQKGLSSQNTIARNLSSFFTGWANGLPRTREDLRKKLYLNGSIKLARRNMEKQIVEMRKLINNDLEALERVHRVLDPEIYKAREKDNYTPLTYDDLNTNEQILYNHIRSILDYTHEYNYQMGFINEELYEKNKGTYTPRMYEGYEIPDEVKEIYDKTNDWIATKIDNSIFKKRKEISEQMADTILKDPIYSAAKRMMQTDVNASVAAYAEYIANQKGLTSGEPKKGFTQLRGNAYGALNDLYVPNYIAEDFKGYFFANEQANYLYMLTKAYDRSIIRQIQKQLFTVYNPGVQLGNFTSNYVFAFASGIDPLTFSKNMPKAYQTLQSKNEDFEFLLQNGIIDSNIISADLTPLTELTLPYLDKDQVNKSAIDKIKKLGEYPQKIYQGSDNIAKTAAYFSFIEQGYTQQEAVDKVYDSFQNYATVGKIWDLASKLPFWGNAFVKFQGDLQRILKNAFTRRPLTTAAYVAILYSIAEMASQISGESEEEKNLREQRPFIPKIPVGFTNIPLTFKYRDSEINLARYLSPLYLYDLGDKENPIESFSKFLPLQVRVEEREGQGSSSYSLAIQDPTLGPIANILADKDFRGKSIADPTSTKYRKSGATQEEQNWNRLLYISRSYIPMFRLGNDLFTSYTDGVDYYDRPRTAAQVLLSNVIKSQRFSDAEYLQQLERDLQGFEYKAKTLSRDASNVLTTVANSIAKRKEKLDSEPPSITEKQYEDYVQEQLNTSNKRLSEILENMAKLQSDFNDYSTSFQSLFPTDTDNKTKNVLDAYRLKIDERVKSSEDLISQKVEQKSSK